MIKKRIIKKYEQLPAELLALIKERYPDGYDNSLISFQTPKGELEFAIPIETEDTIYMIKIPKRSVSEDDDEGFPDGDSDNLDKFDGLEAADEVADDSDD